MEKKPRVYTMSLARMYPLYVARVERKGRSKAEVDEILRWLTGYTRKRVKMLMQTEIG